MRLLSAIVASPAILPASVNALQHRNNNHYNNNRTHNNNNSNYRRNNNNNWSPQQYNNNKSEPRTSRPYLGKCQICNVQGHSARRCPQLHALQQPGNQPPFFQPWQRHANLAVGSPYTTSNWLLDSGAKHHITYDLNNLSLHQPYTGGDDVMIADGSNLSVSHTGSILFPSSTRNLLLNKILCVPDINKNLISVYRLCNTNQVSVEFFPASF